jgi:hypothetical protein
MAEQQYEFSCQSCGRTFKGTEHSIRGLAARGGTCSYCRGPLVFPSSISLPPPPTHTTNASGARLEQVDRVIARSSAPEPPARWDTELPAALLQAEVLSIGAAALFVDSWRHPPIFGLVAGFGISAIMYLGAQLYRLLRQANVPLFRGKGFFLRAVLGPVLMLVAFGAILSPIHRWLRHKVPLIASAPAMAGAAAVCLSIVGALQAIHNPLRRLEPILAETRAAERAVDDHFEAGDVWSGTVRAGSAGGPLESLGLGDALGAKELSLDIGSIDGKKLEGRVQLPGAQVHVRGLVDGNVVALVGDRMLAGTPVSDWPLATPITGAIDETGLLHQAGRGPKFELRLAAPP